MTFSFFAEFIMEGLNPGLCFLNHSVDRVQLLQEIFVKHLVTLIHKAKIQNLVCRKQPVLTDNHIIYREPVVKQKPLWIGGMDLFFDNSEGMLLISFPLSSVTLPPPPSHTNYLFWI